MVSVNAKEAYLASIDNRGDDLIRTYERIQKEIFESCARGEFLAQTYIEKDILPIVVKYLSRLGYSISKEMRDIRDDVTMITITWNDLKCEL